jgi:hypothetical protein
MGIVFHCEYCGKKIEAPDRTGGKWGKCPACHNKLYVPDLGSGEELKLAPIDESEQEREKQLMAETYKLSQDILSEKETPAASAEDAVSVSSVSDKELTKNIIKYLQHMANGELDEAERIANLIAPYHNRAVNILDQIALSEIPEPELAYIPQQILVSLIRDLRSRIS